MSSHRQGNAVSAAEVASLQQALENSTGLAEADFGFLYHATKRNLEYGSPVVLLLVTLGMLALAQERTFIFALILVIGVLFALACLVYESSTSLHLFGFVLTWYYWLIYSYGYLSSTGGATGGDKVFVDVSQVGEQAYVHWGAWQIIFKVWPQRVQAPVSRIRKCSRLIFSSWCSVSASTALAC